MSRNISTTYRLSPFRTKSNYIFFRHLIISAFLIIVFFSSCENQINFEGEDAEPKIVFNAIIQDNQNIVAQMFESRFFLDDYYSFDEIKYAKPELWVNNKFIETLNYNANMYEAGEYYSQYVPKAGDKIKIKATAPRLKDIVCETEIKPHINNISVDTDIVYHEPNNYNNGNNFVEYKFNLKFPDKPGELNYYRLDVKLAYYTADGYFFYSNMHTLNLTDTVFAIEKDQTGGYLEDYLNKNSYQIFSDKLFNGKEYNLKFSISKSKQEYEDTQYCTKQKIFINLQHITKDYYLYLKTRELADAKELIPTFFTEPVQIYNNIQNGIGILGSFTNNINEIEIELSERY